MRVFRNFLNGTGRHVVERMAGTAAGFGRSAADGGGSVSCDGAGGFARAPADLVVVSHFRSHDAADRSGGARSGGRDLAGPDRAPARRRRGGRCRGVGFRRRRRARPARRGLAHGGGAQAAHRTGPSPVGRGPSRARRAAVASAGRRRRRVAHRETARRHESRRGGVDAGRVARPSPGSRRAGRARCLAQRRAAAAEARHASSESGAVRRRLRRSWAASTSTRGVGTTQSTSARRRRPGATCRLRSPARWRRMSRRIWRASGTMRSRAPLERGASVSNECGRRNVSARATRRPAQPSRAVMRGRAGR
jgi:hypothetical protein